ncbi:hypothetical protein A3A21_02580 [Candidatus Jorgensenbacteria bacterium RIFCSPLOWO2_01_FULL_45_25b]|uniref:Probable cytosol aminopeptidase n=1 Tax=Candidatus Jorgensenbacteria bacterium RIFCSPLOWO2_01_FULL_45_25b TaxID=1798471 RepID=A0A1F6BZR9_9BACT|nr:MAG: hypothetical protein A3A21_02580 [Candidatus Jorgensenbacteria bacterium RIFCSPLOWO2_01_FULL_45_25b]
MINITYSETKPEVKEIALARFEEGNDSWTQVLQSGQKEIVIGIGKKEDFTRRKFIITARRIAVSAKAGKIKKIAVSLENILSFSPFLKEDEAGELLIQNMELANFEFVAYKTQPEEGWNVVEEVIIYGAIKEEIKQAIERGQMIADEVNASRKLINTPGGEMTPSVLAEAAKKAAQGLDIKVSMLGKKEIQELKMGGILGVSEGSREEPKFILMEYMGGEGKPIVLVGKGVTFDTGGLSLKPEQYMYEMHMDMSGGGAVIHTIALAAKLKLKKNIVALIPAVENMPSGSSYRPGDILKTMSGKTIEVLNTDAEGRIILADALTYAKKYNPELVIDVATLTGAASVALGERASAIFSKDESLIEKIRKSGEESGDYVWPLPLWEEYEEDIKGTFGDVANSTKTRYGGAITAAVFLYQFVKDVGYSWLHIDMAPRMTSIEGEYLAKGSSGAPIQLLINFLRKL